MGAYNAIIPVAPASNKRGTVYSQDNATAFTIRTADVYHCYHIAGAVADNLDGWTFIPGSAGTPIGINSVADSGGTALLVTTASAHGLVVGNILSQTGMAQAAHAGVFRVATVPDTTSYTVPGAFGGADATGFIDVAAQGLVGATAAGDYIVQWSASASSAQAGRTIDFEMNVNGAELDGSKVKRVFSTGAAIGSLSGLAMPTLAAGDSIAFVAKNDAVQDFTMTHLTITVHRVSAA